MAQDLSIEYPEHVVFITIRTIGSRLWFVNNTKLHEQILAYLAKYQEHYGVIIHGFIIMGNHYHLLAQFPNANRAAFLQAFNSILPRLVSNHVPNFQDGKLWARRARVQVVPNVEDILNQFLYLTLNPVSSGLCQKLSEFNGYNCIHDIRSFRDRALKLIDWADYKNRSRYNKKLTPDDCSHTYILHFSRLPGFEKLSEEQYTAKLIHLLEERRATLIAERTQAGKGFAGKVALRKTRPGAKPYSTKTSLRHSKRPLVLTLCNETRKYFLELYFSVVEMYKTASKRFRAGDWFATFPPGTYRPVVPVGI